MEAVVQTTNQEEIEQASSAGASIISVVGKAVEDAVELRQYIPDSVSVCIALSVGFIAFTKRGAFPRRCTLLFAQ